jgi:hypothetical protein
MPDGNALRGTAMPYQPHPAVTPPADPATTIWRYVSLAQFLDMLERDALWFSQLLCLADPFEGVPAEPNLEQWTRQLEELRADLVADGMDPEAAQRWSMPPSYETTRLLTCVNCWHMNEFESLAMWRIYSKDGIAIRSTFQHLVDSVHDAKEDILIGKVLYRDRRDPASVEPLTYIFEPALRKGMSYAYEQELRAFVLQTPRHDDPTTFPPGLNIVPMHLDVLIDGVYVAPGSAGWIKELVGRIMDQYGLRKPLESADLDARPRLT